jgi:hypothetical protein
MEPSCDAAAAPSTSTMNSRRFDHLIHAVRAREGMVSAWGQQRPRSCETARGLGSNLPRRTASQKGITCSMRGSRPPWRGQDDRLRRSSPTHRRVASIPQWSCTTLAVRSNTGQSFRSAFERGQVHLDHGKPPWPEAMSESGQKRRFDCQPISSGLPRWRTSTIAGSTSVSCQTRKWAVPTRSLVRTGEKGCQNLDTEQFRCLEIDGRQEFGGLLRSLEVCGLTGQINPTRIIR